MLDYSKITFNDLDNNKPVQVFYTYDLTENELDRFLTNYIIDVEIPEDKTVTAIELCLTIFDKGDYKLEAICKTEDDQIWVELWYQVTNTDELLNLIPEEYKNKI